MATVQPQGFNTMGATPNLSSAYGTAPNLSSAYSGGSAINKALAGVKQQISPQKPYVPQMSAAPTTPSSGVPYAPFQTGLLPTTPVKSIQQSNVDGSSTTHTFHAPDTTTAPATAPGTYKDPNGDTIDANGNFISLSPENQAKQASGSANAAGQANAGTTYPGLISQATQTAKGNADIGQNAANIAKQYGQKIANVGTEGNNQETGYLSSMGGGVGVGNAGLVANSVSARQAALAAGESAALEGTGQQLTAQSQEQNGLLGAGALAQPTTVAPGSTLVSPTTGSTVAGGIGGLTSYNAFQNFSNIQSSYPDANIKYDDKLSPQENLAKAQSQLQSSPTYQKSLLSSGINPQGGNTLASVAGNQANQSGYGESLNSYQNTNTQVKNVSDFGNLLLSTGSGQNINPFDLNFANKTLAQFKSNLSSGSQAAFNSSLAAFSGVASQLLANSSGQIPTDVSGNIAKIADGTISMSGLKSLVDQANLEGHTKLGNLASQVVNYQSQLNGQPAPNLPGTLTQGGKNYVLQSDGTYNEVK